MSGHLRSIRLWAVAAAAGLVACQTAAALPPRDSATGSVSHRGLTALQPLPALVCRLPTTPSPAAEAVGGLPFAASLSTLEATTAPDDPRAQGTPPRSGTRTPRR